MIYAEVFYQQLKLVKEHIVSDTIDYLEMKFNFRTDNWNGMEKWVHFAKDGEVYDIPLTEDKTRREDHLNLSAGRWHVYLHGNRFENGKVIERVTTNQAMLEVQPTGTLDGEPFPEIPASETERILARLSVIEKNGGTGDGGIVEESDPTVPDWAKQPEPPKYTAEEVGALPSDTPIPEKTSELENDSGYITISVANLLNYYLKTEVYSRTEAYNRTEVDNLISGLSKRLNAVADSTDVNLDQLGEIVAYIKSNKSLIDGITISKVSVGDIIDNLATSDAKKPLSAAQGKVLKDMYDALPAWSKKSVKPVYTKAEIGLGNVDNVKQYSTQNPPPYPVTTVNGKTGIVQLGAADVGAATKDQLDKISATIDGKLAKNQGASNAGKILVVGTDGNLVLTDMPEGGAGGDVTGVFDENNNILLSGNIAAGTYTLMFENADGTYTGSGTLVVTEVVPEPTWTNFADPSSADWKTGVRLTNNINETTALSGGAATNYIAVNAGDTLEVTGINIADSNSRTAYDFGGDYANILKPAALATSSSLSDVSYDENGIICTIAAPQSDSMKIRFSGLLTGTSDDVVIKIKRNGEYL